MTDVSRSTVLAETASRGSFVQKILAFRFKRAMPAGEKHFLLALLSVIAVAAVVLYIVTPVPLRAILFGFRMYAFLPFVSVSIVAAVVWLAERFVGHRIPHLHARGQWMLMTAIVTSATIPVFGMFKQYVLKTQGFPFDPALAAADRILFAGHDAWQVMHALFESLWFTILVDQAYAAWLALLMFCPVLWAAVIADPLVRARLIGCWLGVWIMIGGVGAWLLASAGPMYYPHFIGPNASFAQLHDRIVALGEMAKAAGTIITTPYGHMALLHRYENGGYSPGYGISAMPSVHVSMAVLFAIGGFAIRRWLGLILSAYALLIWIGSVYLGWHYALDGIVGTAMTIGLWKLSAKIAEPFARDTDAA